MKNKYRALSQLRDRKGAQRGVNEVSNFFDKIVPENQLKYTYIAKCNYTNVKFDLSLTCIRQYCSMWIQEWYG